MAVRWQQLRQSGRLSSLLFFCLLGVSAQAQQVEVAQTSVAEEQNETFRDTLVRMRIKREEDEHKKTIAKAEQIKLLVTELLNGVNTAQHLPRTMEKQLKEIEKNARKIRTDSGGGDDTPLDELPTTLDATIKQLGVASERLNEKLGKTSRHIVSIMVVNEATEIIQLVKLLRGYLR